MEENDLSQLEQLIGYTFSNSELLVESVTHSSQADHRLESNERLEFFGDAVLDLVICQELFERFPTYDEGDLTKIKSMLVSRKTCAKVANQIELPRFTKVGKGMSSTRAVSGSIAAGTLEAIIAAVYLDGGFDSVREFILRTFGSLIEKVDAMQHQENFKSLLQQFSQSTFNCTPLYELLDEKGPDHNKCFEVAVFVHRRRFKSAWGITKKDAEQKAAYNALIELKQIKPVKEHHEE